jgi:hypothetical protein
MANQRNHPRARAQSVFTRRMNADASAPAAAPAGENLPAQILPSVQL